jgi:hypothetical protein
MVSSESFRRTLNKGQFPFLAYLGYSGQNICISVTVDITTDATERPRLTPGYFTLSRMIELLVTPVLERNK